MSIFYVSSGAGNDFMKAEKFSDALESYTKAIRLDGKNAVYYCNR